MKLLLAVALLTSTAFANVIFTLGNQPEPHEYNVSISGSGNPIVGIFAKNQKVYFAAPGNPLIVQGQEILSQSGGFITDLGINLAEHTFNGAIFNPFNPVMNNDLLIEVETPLGGSSFLYGASDNNFLTITTTGEPIDFINILSKSGFQGFEPVGIIDNAAPEPSSLALLGSGLVGIGALLRKKLFC